MSEDQFNEAVEATNSPSAKRIERLEAEVARLREALEGLVAAHENWNSDVIRIIGRPTYWSDSYLDAARKVLEETE